VVEVVQHGDQRPPLGVQLRAQVEHLDLMSDVEEGGGLVEQQQRRGLGQRHREPETLAGALYFISPLSLPYVLERLTRQLEAAVAGRAPKKVLTP
jgi:hypothetical protein